MIFKRTRCCYGFFAVSLSFFAAFLFPNNLPAQTGKNGQGEVYVITDDVKAEWQIYPTIVVEPGDSARYMYTAKIVCGRQLESNNFRLARGIYSTAINIHNPNEANVYFLKKLAFTFPPGYQKEGHIDTISVDVLRPDGALCTDCIDLQKRLYPGGFPAPYIEGFLVLKSTAPLDVTGVYTASKPRGIFSPQRVTSIDIEQIRERRLMPLAPPQNCPDLVVQDIDDLRVSCPTGPGSCVITVSATIANIGDVPSGPFSVRFEISPGIVVSQNVPGGLPPGGTIDVLIATPPGNDCHDPATGQCTITVTADSNFEVSECLETNNVRTEMIQ